MRRMSTECSSLATRVAARRSSCGRSVRGATSPTRSTRTFVAGSSRNEARPSRLGGVRLLRTRVLRLVARMRYALISDIHANLPALDAVLADIGANASADAVYHLGDLVGYGPWPNEVVDRIEHATSGGVAGNYDSTVATDYKHCGCRYEDARQEELSHISYAWTREHVSAHAKAWLGTLPLRKTGATTSSRRWGRGLAHAAETSSPSGTRTGRGTVSSAVSTS